MAEFIPPADSPTKSRTSFRKTNPPECIIHFKIPNFHGMSFFLK